MSIDDFLSRVFTFAHDLDADPPPPLMSDELLARRLQQAERHDPGTEYHRLLLDETARREAEWERIAPSEPCVREWLAAWADAYRLTDAPPGAANAKPGRISRDR